MGLGVGHGKKKKILEEPGVSHITVCQV